MYNIIRVLFGIHKVGIITVPSVVRKGNVFCHVCLSVHRAPHVTTHGPIQTCSLADTFQPWPQPPTHMGTPDPDMFILVHLETSLALVPARPVQICSLCSPCIYRQVGSWPLTERPSFWYCWHIGRLCILMWATPSVETRHIELRYHLLFETKFSFV